MSDKTGDSFISNFASANVLTINGIENKTMLTITPDGKLIPGPGLSMDEATQQAAQMLAEHYGRAMLKIKLEEESRA